MNTIAQWGKPVAMLAIAVSTVGYLNTPSSAVTESTTANFRQTQKSESNVSERQGNVQLAQGIVGQCRAAKQRIFVYPERSTSSQSIRTLAPNELVTLADTGAAGWIAISAPIAGYVRASELKPCPGGTRPPTPAPTPAPTPTPTPTPTPSPTPTSSANSCRKVIYPPEGLAVRNTPVITSPRISGVYVGNTVKLASPRQSQKDSQGRTWVLISSPTTGWISSGYPSGNLGPEFSCP